MKANSYFSLIILFAAVTSLVWINRKRALTLPDATTWKTNDSIDLWVNKIVSEETQLSYRYHELPVCKPSKSIRERESLGEKILGDTIEKSSYKLHVGRNEPCLTLCSKVLSTENVTNLKSKIIDKYRIIWLLDHLPAVHINRYTGDHIGIPLGEKKEQNDGEAIILYNHHDITIHYNQVGSNWQIILFEVNPRSVQQYGIDDCSPSDESPIILNSNSEFIVVNWTYSVNWIETSTLWAQRWDQYLKGHRSNWPPIMISLMIVLFSSCMAANVLVRTLYAEERRYDNNDNEDPKTATGWISVYGDVFRPPTRRMLLSALVGSGVQVGGMSMVVIVFTALGFLHPSNRGGLLNAILFMFVWMSVFGGYFSTRVYKNLGGEDWKKNAICTIFFFPGIIFGVFVVLSLFLWSSHASTGVSFETFISLVAIWFISGPLSYFGSYYAWGKVMDKQPTVTNEIPRQIPNQVWYRHPIITILMGGILPFVVVFYELYYIVVSLWLHQRFYVWFGFLFLTFLILILTCIEISIVMCFFQLKAEDYRWWWRSYLTSGAMAFYVFLFTIHFLITRLQITHFTSVVLYLGYSFMVCFAFFVITGSIGFFSCYYFVQTIYAGVSTED
eukprot:TRINITY_DN2867_c0_g2_i1.p1 TRINITY_DN2867_c0_g2~~TRINITY_DN2867_c0_g2_i1.p1  ORF type:complete len:615 (-),score=63.94 TRINITY_DN2867_c0_g2_i1:9-1853(-)